MKLTMLLVLLAPFINASAANSPREPYFCHPDNFTKLERRDIQSGENRLRVFQIGKLTLAGMAIGDSDSDFVDQVASRLSGAPRSEKSCTWYVNKGNPKAEALFNHAYVPGPMPWTSIEQVADKYLEVLGPHYLNKEVNIVNCVERHNYVAFGCNGQKHRGPSTFAMFLSVAGCSPKNTAQIVKRIWGSNHVSSEHRTAISQRGYELGNQNPQIRASLQKVMLAQ